MIDQGLSGQRQLSLSRCGNEWGSDALQLWSWMLSYWWHELERGREGEMKMRRRQMKWDEHLLWDVSALRSFVISGRTYETLEFIISLPVCDMRTALTPISLHFCFCLTLSTYLCTCRRWKTLLCRMSFNNGNQLKQYCNKRTKYLQYPSNMH